jgi:hypothetical protein
MTAIARITAAVLSLWTLTSEALPESSKTQHYHFDWTSVVSDTHQKETECDVSWKELPFRGRYSHLSPEARQWLRQWYEEIPDQDVPPYPMYGLGEIIDRVGRRLHYGDIALPSNAQATVLVEVGSTGKAITARAIKNSDKQLSQAVISILGFIEFDPAKCSGKVCSMQFPIQLTFDCKDQVVLRPDQTIYVPSFKP